LVVGELCEVWLKSKASHYFAVLLRCSLAVGLKMLGQAAWGVKRVVHSAEQRQIAQQGTTVDVALRKNVAAHYHGFRLTSGLRSQNFLELKNDERLERRKDLTQSKVPTTWPSGLKIA
jgi:hypothetical protein